MARANLNLPEYFERDAVDQLAAAAVHERDRLLVQLLWHTGARAEEALTARVGQISDDGLRMLNEKQRRARQKFVFLPPAFVAELRAYTAGWPPDRVIVGRLSDGEKMTRQRAGQIIRLLVKRAGVLRTCASLHGFRHGYAVNLMRQGVPITVIQDQLGHASLANTQVYAKLADPHRAAEIAKVRF